MSENTTMKPKRKMGRRATGYDPQFIFRAPAELIEAARAAAARRGVVTSVIGREALAAYVRSLGQEEAGRRRRPPKKRKIEFRPKNLNKPPEKALACVYI
jgi:hypothetical protein